MAGRLHAEGLVARTVMLVTGFDVKGFVACGESLAVSAEEVAMCSGDCSVHNVKVHNSDINYPAG